MFWRINDPISEFGVGVGACRPQFCSTAIRLRRCRRGLRKKHGHAHARIKNQRGKRFDRLGHASATDILPDSQSHYLKLCERTLSFAVFLAEEGEVALLESPNGLGAARSCRPPGRCQYYFLAETEKSLNRRLRGFRRYGPNRRVQFDKRGQLFIGTHNERLSVITVCVRDKDRSPPRDHSPRISNRAGGI